MLAGGRRSSAYPRLPLASPSAATLSGNSAPQTPGPAIGSMRTSSAVSFTAPDFRHAFSASALQGSRSAVKKPRPQPASETRIREPTRYKQTPRVIRASSPKIIKDFSTHCYLKNFNHVDAPDPNSDPGAAARLTLSGWNASPPSTLHRQAMSIHAPSTRRERAVSADGAEPADGLQGVV